MSYDISYHPATWDDEDEIQNTRIPQVPQSPQPPRSAGLFVDPEPGDLRSSLELASSSHLDLESDDEGDDDDLRTMVNNVRKNRSQLKATALPQTFSTPATPSTSQPPTSKSAETTTSATKNPKLNTSGSAKWTQQEQDDLVTLVNSRRTPKSWASGKVPGSLWNEIVTLHNAKNYTRQAGALSDKYSRLKRQQRLASILDDAPSPMDIDDADSNQATQDILDLVDVTPQERPRQAMAPPPKSAPRLTPKPKLTPRASASKASHPPTKQPTRRKSSTAVKTLAQIASDKAAEKAAEAASAFAALSPETQQLATLPRFDLSNMSLQEMKATRSKFYARSEAIENRLQAIGVPKGQIQARIDTYDAELTSLRKEGDARLERIRILSMDIKEIEYTILSIRGKKIDEERNKAAITKRLKELEVDDGGENGGEDLGFSNEEGDY